MLSRFCCTRLNRCPKPKVVGAVVSAVLSAVVGVGVGHDVFW